MTLVESLKEEDDESLAKAKADLIARSKGVKAGEHLRIMCATSGKNALHSVNDPPFGRVHLSRGDHVVAVSDEEHTFTRGRRGAMMVRVLTAKGAFWLFSSDLERVDDAVK